MNMKRPPSSSRRVRGMTLIELIIVVVLIGLVAAAVGSKVINNKKNAEAKIAMTQLNSLAAQSSALQFFAAEKRQRADFVRRRY